VIQLLELATLCCTGHSSIAEIKCKASILTFRVAKDIVTMSGRFFPLKNAVMNYINECFLDSADKSFLAKPADEENDGE